MRLEKALGLKEGDVVVATNVDIWVDSGQFTERREYVLRKDAKPVWPGHRSDRPFSGKQLRPGDKPCNAELPIMDDRKNLVFPGYYSFEVKPKKP